MRRPAVSRTLGTSDGIIAAEFSVGPRGWPVTSQPSLWLLDLLSTRGAALGQA